MRLVFQALRIAVNDEFFALDTFLRNLSPCLNPGGRVAILTFHSGEDRRVKKAFETGLREGRYAEIANEVVRPGPEERRANPRALPQNSAGLVVGLLPKTRAASLPPVARNDTVFAAESDARKAGRTSVRDEADWPCNRFPSRIPAAWGPT